MRAALIAGAAVLLVVASLGAWQLRKHGEEIAEWFDDTFRRARFYDVLKTFCAEAAVLWLVFPVIDVWEANGSKSWLVVYLSPLFALFFMVLSGLFARQEEVKKREEEKGARG